MNHLFRLFSLLFLLGNLSVSGALAHELHQHSPDRSSDEIKKYSTKDLHSNEMGICKSQEQSILCAEHDEGCATECR